MNHELLEIKEMVENDNLILEVKDNLLKNLKESCEELQLHIEELKKSKSNNNDSKANVEKSRLKIPIPSFKGTDQEYIENFKDLANFDVKSGLGYFCFQIL